MILLRSWAYPHQSTRLHLWSPSSKIKWLQVSRQEQQGIRLSMGPSEHTAPRSLRFWGWCCWPLATTNLFSGPTVLLFFKKKCNINRITQCITCWVWPLLGSIRIWGSSLPKCVSLPPPGYGMLYVPLQLRDNLHVSAEGHSCSMNFQINQNLFFFFFQADPECRCLTHALPACCFGLSPPSSFMVLWGKQPANELSGERQAEEGLGKALGGV